LITIGKQPQLEEEDSPELVQQEGRGARGGRGG